MEQQQPTIFPSVSTGWEHMENKSHQGLLS